MIPERDVCPPRWKKEYTEYVMAEHNGNKHSKPYLCVDDTPQVFQALMLALYMDYCTRLKPNIRHCNVNHSFMEESCVVLFAQYEFSKLTCTKCLLYLALNNMKVNNDKLRTIIVITFMLFNGRSAQSKQVVSI